jgi:hypothetical protein
MDRSTNVSIWYPSFGAFCLPADRDDAGLLKAKDYYRAAVREGKEIIALNSNGELVSVSEYSSGVGSM